MKNIIAPPFAECPDNIRCGQTVISMILKHFKPEREWTFQDADRICGYVEGKTTWHMLAILGMIAEGFEVITISGFDREWFVRDTVACLYDYYGEEYAKASMARSDVSSAVEATKKLASSEFETYIQRGWEWSDVERLLEEGYLIQAWVSPSKFYNRNSYNPSGHYVLIYGYQPEFQTVIYHDGGSILPATEQSASVQCNLCQGGRVGTDFFIRAAKAPNKDEALAITAYRLRK